MESKLKSKIAYVDSGSNAGTVSNEGFSGSKSDQKWGRQMEMQIKNPDKTDKN